ncbi:glycosyltransferase family 2 protein [Cohnella yongneupensis]|uniref:Glycosyltransferase family 2 protein n=1 Tax=Cohnella yongneupensis TaxID=425006 RepID=A0ABW0R3V2_9BACL
MSQIVPVSILIPTMNRNQSFKRTIECLMSKEYIPAHIIVVDQSPDSEVRQLNQNILDKYSNLTKTTYLFQEIPSLTRARNLAIKHCDDEIMIFSDDDVDVNDDTLINIYKVMSNSKIAMIAGIDENEEVSDRSSLMSYIGYFFCTKSFKNRNIGHVTKSMLGRFPHSDVKGEVETQWAMGYFFVVRKSLIDKWKLNFDEKFSGYAYAEDLDFSHSYYQKAKTEGLKCILIDKVKVKHMVSREYRTPSSKSTFMFVINREYLSYKHKTGVLSRMAIRWNNIGIFMFRLARNGKSGKSMDVIRAQWKCDSNRNKIRSGDLDDMMYR